ncbi:MAG: thiopurine S-methyltransferase [Deltaproteobacteria bacterium]|nr:thiopurine S-methyltransferase [Deltaproteobacteria bacterium]
MHPAATPAFWHERWTSNQIGFHQATTNELLSRHWHLDRGRVIVPLCGASRDLAWLAARGHEVVGVELSELACARFFEEHGLLPEREGNRWRAGAVTLVQGDFFAFSEPGAFDALYDRAALIALPPGVRPRYVDHLRHLLRAPRGLLISFEYDQQKRDGPPFAVMASEVRALWPEAVEVERRPVDEERWRELGGVSEVAWRI